MSAPTNRCSTHNTGPTLRKAIGTFDAVAILIAITIGAGIFSTPQIIAGYLPSLGGIILCWLLGGAFICVGGLIYAELGTRLPQTGGEYVYLTRSFGPYVGFLFGWKSFFMSMASSRAGLAIIVADYIGHFVQVDLATRNLIAITVIAVLGMVNYVGIEWSILYQKVGTIVKTGALSLLVIIGYIVSQGQGTLIATEALPTATLGLIGNVTAAMMLIFFTYSGWSWIGYVAGEMKNPRRGIPLGMLFGVGTVITVYVSIIVLYHHVLGMEGVRATSTAASDVAVRLVGPVGASLIALLVIISATSSMNGAIMAASRLFYAMAKDGLFFRWFDFVHPVFRTPSRSIIAHCVWSVVILLARQKLETILAGMAFTQLIFSALVALALFKLRKEGVGERDAYRMPFYPLLPVVYILGITAFVIFRLVHQPDKALVDIAIVAVGLPVAWFWCRRASNLLPEAAP